MRLITTVNLCPCRLWGEHRTDSGTPPARPWVRSSPPRSTASPIRLCRGSGRRRSHPTL